MNKHTPGRGFSYLRLRPGVYAVRLNGEHVGSVHRTKQGRWSPVDRFESETTREDAAELALYHYNNAAIAEAKEKQ